MKRLPRNSEKFDVIDLFAAMAREHGYELEDPTSIDDFVARIRASFDTSKNCPVTVFGKRVEALFAYVVGALGAVSLLKQEDSGDVYFTGEEIAPPDYRLTLKSGEQFLVEVKNCHHHQPKKKIAIIKKTDLKKRQRYAELNKVSLKIAIFFSAWNKWALVTPDNLEERGNSCVIDFVTAIAKSEMATIGDCMIATTPDLEILLETNENEAQKVSEDGSAAFVTRNISISCAGKVIERDIEKNIAFYLMRFGDWVESENEAIMRDGRLVGLRFRYSPEEPVESQHFQFIGTMSSMVSTGFREITAKEGKVLTISLKSDPTLFKVLIPENYQGEKLPLWRFTLQPNLDFGG
jgi:hypothetical protein